MTIKAKVTLYLLFLVLAFARPAHAYLDPNTGSYLFQFLIAGLLGGTFFLRGSLQKIINKLTGRKEKPTSEDDDADDKDK